MSLISSTWLHEVRGQFNHSYSDNNNISFNPMSYMQWTVLISQTANSDETQCLSSSDATNERSNARSASKRFAGHTLVSPPLRTERNVWSGRGIKSRQRVVFDGLTSVLHWLVGRPPWPGRAACSSSWARHDTVKEHEAQDSECKTWGRRGGGVEKHE